MGRSVTPTLTPEQWAEVGPVLYEALRETLNHAGNSLGMNYPFVVNVIHTAIARVDAMKETE